MHGQVVWEHLANSATIQTHNQDSELALPNLNPIHDLLEDVKGLVPWNHSHKISRSCDNSRLSERSFNEGLVAIPETRGLEPAQQHVIHRTFTSKAVWTKGSTA